MLFVVLNTVFMEKRKDKIKGNLKNVVFLGLAAVAFSVPYVSYYLTFFKNSSSEMVGLHLLDIQFSLPSFAGLWGMMPFFVTGVAGGLGLFAVVKHFKENKSLSFLLLSLLLTPLILYFTTAQPVRWEYFLPIPFFLYFSIFLRDLHIDVKMCKKTTIVLFTLLFAVTILLQSAFVTSEHIGGSNGSIHFYQFIGDGEIDALNWINQTTPKDSIFATSGDERSVGGGGNAYAWWIEGYSNRICMFTGDLQYYSFQFERDEVRTTNRIFAGTYTVDYSDIEVTDSYPAGVNNPRVSVLVDGQYQGVLTINDGQNQVTYVPNDDPQTASIGFFYAENKTYTYQYSNTSAVLSVTYGNPQFETTRTIAVGEQNSTVDITYQIHPINGTLNEVKINLWSLFATALEDCQVDNASTVTLSQGSSKDDIKTVISMVDTNGNFSGARVIFDNPAGSAPVVSYRFGSTDSDLFVHLRVKVYAPESSDGSSSTSEVKFYDSYQLINNLKIDYIFVNRYRDMEVQRFLRDSSHFTLEFQNDRILIFKVTS
jgi:hypothetical protein